MVNATIDNPPVSVQFSEGQSVTVPQNETWRVTLTFFDKVDQSGQRIKLNGENVFGMVGSMPDAIAMSPTVDMVLTGGDILELKGNSTSFVAGAAVQGFVVNS